MTELVRQTHEHALANAAGDAASSRLTFRGGIEPWWRDAANLTKDEFGRLFHLRTDVVEKQASRRRAWRAAAIQGQRCCILGLTLAPGLTRA